MTRNIAAAFADRFRIDARRDLDGIEILLNPRA